MFNSNSLSTNLLKYLLQERELQVKNAVELWVPNDVECHVYTSFPKKSLPGRKKKRPSNKSTSSSWQHGSSKETASVENKCIPERPVCHLLLCGWLNTDVRKNPKFGKKLKELIDIEEGIETEGAVRYSQALPVSEQVILVTSLNEWPQ